jgi:hypothetical protein
MCHSTRDGMATPQALIPIVLEGGGSIITQNDTHFENHPRFHLAHSKGLITRLSSARISK